MFIITGEEMREYINAILSPERISFEECEIAVDNYNAFENSIVLLEKLKKRGKLDYNFTSLDENLKTHKIVIHWKDDSAGYTELNEEDLSFIREILSNKEAAVIDHVENTLTIFSTVFKERK